VTEPPGGPRLDRWDLAIVAAGAAAVGLFSVAEQRIAGAPGLPLDDGWIHLRLAQNLAAGRGFGINPGEPVAASTAPLWTLAVAGLLAAGLPGLAAVKALGLACFVGTALAARRLAGAAGLPGGLAVGAGVATAGLARLVWGGLSGMEVPLAALLATLGAWAALRAHAALAALLFGLATLARPEAALLLGLHALAGLRIAEIAGRAALGGLVLAPAAAFNLAYGGRLVPVTAAAKAEGGLVGHAEGLAGAWAVAWREAGAFLGQWAARLGEDHVALPVLLVLGLAALRDGRLRWLAAALVLQPLAMAWVAPYRGPAFQTGRYSSHLLPLATVVALVTIDRLFRRARGRTGRTLAGALLLAGLAWRLPGAADAYAWGVENINAMQVRLGGWVASNTPPDTLIAVNDLGALTYFGQRRVLDLMGLATPEVLPYRRHGDPGLLRYLERRCPEYVIIFPDWFPGVAARTELFRPLAEATLARNVVAGAARMVAYETAWHRARRPAPAPCPGPGAG
jgi:hypothetical protein